MSSGWPGAGPGLLCVLPWATGLEPLLGTQAGNLGAAVQEATACGSALGTKLCWWWGVSK